MTFELYPEIKKEHWNDWLEAFENCPAKYRIVEYIRAWRKEGLRWSVLQRASTITPQWTTGLVKVWTEEGYPCDDVYFLANSDIQDSIVDIHLAPKETLDVMLTSSPALSESIILQILEHRPDMHGVLKQYYKKCNNEQVVSVVENHLDFTPEERLTILRHKYPHYRYEFKSVLFFKVFESDLKKTLHNSPELYALLNLHDVQAIYNTAITFVPTLLSVLKTIFERRPDLAMEFNPGKDILPFLTVVDPALLMVRHAMNPLEKVNISVKKSHEAERLVHAMFAWKDRLPDLSSYLETITLDTHQSLRLFLKVFDIACQYTTMRPITWDVQWSHKKDFHTHERWISYLSGSATEQEKLDFEKMYGKKRGQHLQKLWEIYPEQETLKNMNNILDIYTVLMVSDTSKPKLQLGEHGSENVSATVEELGLLF